MRKRTPALGAERTRLIESPGGDAGPWREWGPYLSERAWGTVREDYSDGGTAWEYFPHDHARSRAYRWNEDGLAGVCDLRQRLCLALALWNGRDPILKERIFGLTGHEGNHGEDAKEYWWYLDSTPTHSWMRWRYHYPQDRFPYERLVEENGRRGRSEPGYELVETGVFDEDRYWVVTVDYAKAAPEDLCMRVRVTNAGPTADTLHVLPTLWFRNTWSWGLDDRRPRLWSEGDRGVVVTEHPELGRVVVGAGPGPDGAVPEVLCCENETNTERLFGVANRSAWPKDGIGNHVIHGAPTVNRDRSGTKAAWWYRLRIDPGETVELRLRLSRPPCSGRRPPALGAGFARVMADREREADEFYAELTPAGISAEEAMVMRQAFTGMLWSKQFYHYDVDRWLAGDPAGPAPPEGRRPAATPGGATSTTST